MQYWIFLVHISSIFLLYWKSVTIAGTGIDCDWPIARYQCPLYGTLEWDCLEARLSCGAGERYHCVRSEAGDWVEVCGQEKICGKGEEPVYSKTLGINCQPCHDPERFEPQANTPSYTYSECRRKKNVCPAIVSTECQIGDRYSENRKCRCMYEKQFIPQGYDMVRDTWRCAYPDQLNCVQETCPETADGRKQFRGPDYRCSPDIVPPQPTPIQTPPYILSTKPSVTKIPIEQEDDSAAPVGLPIQGIAVFLIILALCCMIYIVYRRLKGKTEPPGVPREPFKASSIGYTEVCLTWLPPAYHGGSPVSSYRLEWQQNESEDWASKEIPVKHQHVTYVPAPTREGKQLEPETMIEEKNITYTVTGLQNGTTYLFRVRAKNKQGFGEPLLMKENISTKKFKVPGMPLDFTGDFDMQEKCIVLSWKPPKDDGGQPVIGYGLEYCTIIKTDFWVHVDFVKDDVRWKGSNYFTGGMIYGFKVTAFNEKGPGEPCDLEEPIKFLSTPSAPSDIKVTKVESDNVMLTIQAPENNGGLMIERYRIRSKQEGQEWTEEDELTSLRSRSKTVTMRVAKLTPEKLYYFGVCAENALGKGDFLDTDSPTVLPRKLAQPDRPEGPLKVSDIKPTQLLLTWEPPLDDGGTPITSYLVSWKWPYLKYSVEKTIGQTENTQYRVTNLEEGKEYLFFVRAQNKKGNSEALENKFRTSVANVPGKPAGPLRCTNLTHNSVTLTWNPPDNDGGSPLTGYEAECLYSFRKWLLYSKSLNKDTTSYTCRDLHEGERYTFRVHARNRKGLSEKLEIDEAVEPRRVKVPPDPPESLKAKPKEGKIELSWKPPKSNGWSKLEKYHIYMSKESGPKVQLDTLEATCTTYNVTDLSAEKQYYFEVVAENGVGCGDAARTEKPVRVQEQKKGGLFGFFGDKLIEEKRRSASLDVDVAFEATEDTQKNGMVKSETGGIKSVNNLAPQDIPLPGADVPSTPVGPLNVENVTDSSVDLSWGPPASDGGAEITQFEIEYKQHKQSAWKKAGIVDGITYTYQVTELQEATEYSFRVTAHNEEGPSKPLKSDSAKKTKAKLVPPGAPENLKTDIKGQNSVCLRWDKPRYFELVECTGFIISKRHSTIEEWQRIEKVPPQDFSYLVSKLPYRGVYFSVAAENAAGIGQSAETRKAEKIVYPKGPPSAPVGPLRAVDVDETELTLIWNPPEFDGDYGIDEYCLMKNDMLIDNWKFLKNVPGVVNKYHVTGLGKGRKYAFSVQAVNKKGAGEPLVTDGFVLTKTLTVPLPPSGPLQYSDVTESSVKLIWNPPEVDNQSVTDYFIEFHDTEDCIDYWDKVGIVPGYLTEWTLTGLTPGHSYNFHIIAANAKGESEPLVCKELVHLDQTHDIPSTPIGPLRVENVTSCSVDLSWKHPALDGGAAITEYEVEYKLHKQPSWKRAGSVAGTICTYQVTELLEGTEYSFRVTAYNEEGPSKPLESDSAAKTKAKLDLPDAPEHLETIKKGQNSVRLRWKKPKNFEGFECTGFIVSKRHSATEEWQMIEKVPWRESSYLVSDLPYRDVYFSVAAENVAGIGRSIETKKPETLTYPRGRPSAPLGPLRAVDIDETELTLVWHPPEFNGDYEIDKYRLLRKDWPARHWNFIETVPGQVNKFHVTGLTKGGKYAFSVEAVNKKGAGEPLETDSFVVTKTLTVPLPPSGPLQYSDVTETSVKLNWIPPGDDDPSITSYFIEYHDTKASSVDYWDKYDTTVPGYVTEWTLTGLTPGHSYKFCIIAVNAKGESEPLVCKKVVHLKQALQGQQNTPRSNAQSQGRGNVGGISDREIDSIAHKIGFDWERIGTLLDYQSSQIDNLKHIYKDQPVTRNSRMIKMWADVVASCGESPRILLAAAFAYTQNIEMAELLVPAEQVEAIRDQEARQETKEKIELINFDIPGHSSQSRRSPVVAIGGAGGINFFGGEVTIGSQSNYFRAGSF